MKTELKEGRVEAIWLSRGRRNICREPGAGGCLWFVRRGSQRSKAKGMAPERRRVGLREEKRSGGGQSKAEKKGRGERHREERGEAGHRRS